MLYVCLIMLLLELTGGNSQYTSGTTPELTQVRRAMADYYPGYPLYNMPNYLTKLSQYNNYHIPRYGVTYQMPNLQNNFYGKGYFRSEPIVNSPGYKYYPSSTSFNQRYHTRPYGQKVPYALNSRRFNEIPVTAPVINPYGLSNDNIYVNIPETDVLSIFSPVQLQSLYNENLAYNVVPNNPYAPKEVAISVDFIADLLKMKGGLQEGVYGAKNLFGGAVNIGGGLVRLVKDGAKGIISTLLSKRRRVL